MKKSIKKNTYEPPTQSVLYFMAEGHFCYSGNLPDKMDEDELFEEEFNL